MLLLKLKTLIIKIQKHLPYKTLKKNHINLYLNTHLDNHNNIYINQKFQNNNNNFEV